MRRCWCFAASLPRAASARGGLQDPRLPGVPPPHECMALPCAGWRSVQIKVSAMLVLSGSDTRLDTRQEMVHVQTHSAYACMSRHEFYSCCVACSGAMQPC